MACSKAIDSVLIMGAAKILPIYKKAANSRQLESRYRCLYACPEGKSNQKSIKRANDDDHDGNVTCVYLIKSLES